MGFSVFRFRPFFRSVLMFFGFVPNNFEFSVLVTIAVCSFCSISLSVFSFGKNKIGFLDAVWCCSIPVSLRKICALTISTACTSSLIVFMVFGFDGNLFRFCGFFLIICTVLRCLIYSNAPLFQSLHNLAAFSVPRNNWG